MRKKRKSKNTGKAWTAAEIAYLRKHYVNTPNRVIGKSLLRSPAAVSSRGSLLGLKKDYEADTIFSAQQELTDQWEYMILDNKGGFVKGFRTLPDLNSHITEHPAVVMNRMVVRRLRLVIGYTDM